MSDVMRCPNCQEWVGAKDQFLFRTREDIENKRPGVMYWDCHNCGEQWPV